MNQKPEYELLFLLGEEKTSKETSWQRWSFEKEQTIIIHCTREISVVVVFFFCYSVVGVTIKRHALASLERKEIFI